MQLRGPKPDPRAQLVGDAPAQVRNHLGVGGVLKVLVLQEFLPLELRVNLHIALVEDQLSEKSVGNDIGHVTVLPVRVRDTEHRGLVGIGLLLIGFGVVVRGRRVTYILVVGTGVEGAESLVVGSETYWRIQPRKPS